jgi:ribosomal protein S18 acetylase RimI-like enzyme
MTGGGNDGRRQAMTAGGLIVRRLTPDDWAVSRQIRLAALADAPYAFMSTLAREQDFDEQTWRRRLASPVAATFLAWVDGYPAGTATGKVDNPEDEFTVPGAWQLVGMWVAPDVRGTGVAAALVETVAGYAGEQGADTLVLWVTEVNDRAQAFYRRLGFSPTGARQPVRPDEPDHMELQMVRQLR